MGMEDFCAYATLLDFGDNLRCMKQVAGLASAPRNLPICRLTSCAMQPREQNSLGHGLSRYTTQAMQLREQSSLGHGLSRYTTQAMQPREQSSLGHGLSRYTTQAMQPRRQSLLGHGLAPYKKTISHCFLRERAPDEAA